MKRYSEEEKAEILKEVESVGNVHAVCRKRGISHTTVHNWLKKESLRAGGKNYPAQVRSLKKKVAELELKNAVLKDLLKKHTRSFREKTYRFRAYPRLCGWDRKPEF